jgi:di/tricarboxylate transporter
MILGMTPQQAMSFALILGAVGFFAWGRFRYDFVALATLLIGVVIGIIPAKDAFSGFSNEIVAIIACALVVSHSIARSGVVETVMRPVLGRLATVKTQVPALVGGVTLLSMVTKNIGALAIFMPLAVQLSRRTGTPLSRLLMPMSFGSLLGGLVTMVGTSPNIIVAQVRHDLLGKSFDMFDYAPVGLGLSLIGIVFLSFAYRLLPIRQAASGMAEALEANPYVTEASVPEDWSSQAGTVDDLNQLGAGLVQITSVVRGGARHPNPRKSMRVQPGDTILLQGDQEALESFIVRTGLVMERANSPVQKEEPDDEILATEAVIGRDSILVGKTAKGLSLHERYGVNLLAVSRSGARFADRIRRTPLRAGDVVVLQGSAKLLPGVLRDLGALPLAERPLRLGGVRHAVAPALILAVAMTLVAFKIVPVQIAFFGAALMVLAVGALPMREAYQALDGPVLVLIAALIPVSAAIEKTGGTDLIANALSHLLSGVSPLWALAAMMVTAMAVTPFLNNAATVLVMAPIAVGLANRLHLNPDPLLMGIAVGSACDFLTPIGHQCNTLVMGPGGYRFGDYARLGAALSVFVLVVGVPLIALVWPLSAET